MALSLAWSGDKEFNRCQSRSGVIGNGTGLRMGIRGPNTYQNGGSWSWFGDPRSLYHNGILYTGWTDGLGRIGITSEVVATGVRQTFILKTGITADDHANPGIMVRASDSRVMVFYSAHNGADVFYRVSTSAEDISAFGTEQTLTTDTNDNTYPTPYQTASGRIYVFWRDGAHNLVYQYSDNDGSTWSAETDLITDGTGTDFVYFKIGFDGSERFDIGLSYATAGGVREQVRHCYFTGGALYEADGTSIGTSADLDSIPKVYDSDTGSDSWIWDCSNNGGNPQLAFALVPNGADHTYGYARWNGTSWDVNASVADAGPPISLSNLSGQEEYSGGMSLDHSADGVMYLAINDPGPDDAAIWRYTTANNGTSWSTTLVAGAAPGQRENIRPHVPWNLTAPPATVPVVWMRGIYHDFEAGEFLTAIVSDAELDRPGGAEAKISAFWDFAEASGDIAESTLGDMPGVATALTYGQDGPFGYDAIGFNGSTSKIITATGYTFHGDSDWAFFWWIKTSTTGVNNYLFSGQNTSAFYARLDTNGKFRVAFGGTTGVDTGSAVNDGNWHRVGLICDGAGGRLKGSVDGVVVVNIAQTVGLLNGPFNIGFANNFGTPNSFNGDGALPTLYLDEALSDAQILADYNVFFGTSGAAFLTSAEQTSDSTASGVTATVAASVPANSSATLTLYSDSTPGGQTLSVANGTNDLDFSSVTVAVDDAVWWRWTPSRTVETAEPALTSVTLTGQAGGTPVSLSPGTGGADGDGQSPSAAAGASLSPAAGGADADGEAAAIAAGAALSPGGGGAGADGGQPGVDTGIPSVPAVIAPGAGGAAAGGGQPGVDTGTPPAGPGRMTLNESPVAWMHLWEEPLQ